MRISPVTLFQLPQHFTSTRIRTQFSRNHELQGGRLIWIIHYKHGTLEDIRNKQNPLTIVHTQRLRPKTTPLKTSLTVSSEMPNVISKNCSLIFSTRKVYSYL